MIRIDAAACTGCRCCEAACAFHHTGSGGRTISRIRVVNLYEVGVDAPVVCQQCVERYCLACPSGALTVGSLGQVVVSPTLCSECGACAQSCPLGAIEAVDGLPFVCDLCGGQPRCVEACTPGRDCVRTWHGRPEQPGVVQVRRRARGAEPQAGAPGPRPRVGGPRVLGREPWLTARTATAAASSAWI